MAKRKSKDISAENLKKLAEVYGDAVVTAYVRRKKLKPCNGYKKALKRADYTFSEIIGGRPSNEDGTRYAAVLKFKPVILIIPLLVLLMLGIFFSRITDKPYAEELDIPRETIKEAESTDSFGGLTEDYHGLYISVIGYDRISLKRNEPFIAENLSNNKCIMQYDILFDGKLVGNSDRMLPGETSEIALGDYFEKGTYEIEIVTRSFSMDGNKEFNKANQRVELTMA